MDLLESEFIRLLQQQEGRLYRTAWAILGREQDAWDVLQETVEQAWCSRKKLRGGARAFPNWIKQILVNKALNQLKLKKREILMAPEDMSELSFTLFYDHMDNHSVWQVLKILEDTQRQIVALRFLGDLSLKEISVRLDLPLNTVKSKLYRAIDKFRCILEENYSIGRVEL